MRFRQFAENKANEEAEDTLKKLPKSHRKLLKGYDFKFFGDCNLKGSDENIGMIRMNDDKKKEIHVAAPWNYGRQFAFLHEIAHLVYEELCDSKWKREWKKVVRCNKKRLNQGDEENWCHAYANHFAKNKIVVHTNKEWDDYMKKFCEATG